ncbi:hypothetical protein CGRA01v4_07911 [Colletotrichum graminicola]|nr:hypothetical protein CGRA01v4_07911 [Colletotrichum graminicola]
MKAFRLGGSVMQRRDSRTSLTVGIG